MAALAPDIEGYNRRFYERLWEAGSLVAMPGVAGPRAAAGLAVEIGCGLRPRLPLATTIFVDVSPSACAKVHAAGGRVARATIAALPFRTAALGAVHVFDLLEHVADDRAVAAELGRVIAPGGLLVASAPLHARAWQEWDRVVGHVRRYEPAALLDLVGRAGFASRRSRRSVCDRGAVSSTGSASTT